MQQQRRCSLIQLHTLLEQNGIQSSLTAESHDLVVISDLHLGSDVCRADSLNEFLSGILDGILPTKQLVLNGDVFDSIDFRRLRKHHWKVLSLLRKLSDKIPITWVCGNHDGPAEVISHLLGVRVEEEYSAVSGDRSILILHGHRFDDFIDAHPTITILADLVYHCLQKIDKSHRFATFAKTNSKVFLRCADKIRKKAVAYAAARWYDVVCCGHTHHPESDTAQKVHYFNSGCWTEPSCTYLTVQNGRVQLETFVSNHGTPENTEPNLPRTILELPHSSN